MKKEEKAETVIDIDVLFPRFKEHLDMKGNTRILFSGQFGIGKTYFLTKFFKEHEEKYFCVHLHPTSYQISANEKILEFIKTDVLLSIWDKLGRKVGKEVKKITLIPSENRTWKIVTSLGKTIPIVKEFLGVIDTLVEVIGTVTEEDIKKSLGEVKGKEKVLIIDDLDRMDPQHIFRILNVFSTLVGEEEDTKKETESDRMGFDKIIFVCDIDNVRNIFSHVYGKETDFAGYVDKYYSIEIYQYDDRKTRNIIQNHLDTVLKSFKVSEQAKEQFLMGKETSGYISYLIRETLQMGLKLKTAGPNLRILLKAARYNLPSCMNMKTGDNILQTEMLDQSISALIVIFGDKKILIDCVKNIINENDHEPADSDYEGQASSAVAGLMFESLFDKRVLKCSTTTQAGGGEPTYHWGQSNSGAALELILKPRSGHILLLMKDERYISTKLLFELLLIYLESDLEKL